MSNKLRAATVLVAIGAILGIFLVPVALWRPPALRGDAIDDGYARAAGVVHVHTTLSDGGGTPEAVIEAAQRSGLDFVAINDHNHADAFPLEGYHGATLVLVGTEISTDKGHLLALGLGDKPTFRFSNWADDGVADVRDLGGFLFAAHPHSPRQDFAWTGWDLEGPWGLEIINGDSEWRRAGVRLLPTLMRYSVNRPYALLRLLRSPRAALVAWDRLLVDRDAVGIYGVDAHQKLPLTDTWHLAFPRYEELFDLARNHLVLDAPLTGNPAVDRAAVLRALRAGRFYIGLDGLAAADGFAFVVRAAGGRRWTMGDHVVAEPGLRVVAGGRLPEAATVRLLRDGEILRESDGTIDMPLPGSGVYRVEVLVDGWDVPWVISNPIAVFDADTLATRRVAWPPVAPPVAVVDPIDDFEGGTVFSSNHDAASTVHPPLLAPAAGFGGGGAIRLAFRLGEPAPENDNPFVALINRAARDFSQREGLTFRVKADGVYRLWAQVRDANPGASPELTESWVASVKTSREWRTVSIPFSRLRSIHEVSDGVFDLDAVRALVFVIDKGAMRPGSKGVIWFDDIGVY